MAKKKAEENSVDERVAEVFDVPEPGSEPVPVAAEPGVTDVVAHDDGPRVVIPPTPEQPVEPEPIPETPKERWVREAGHVLAVSDRGDAVSPSELRRLLREAVGFIG